METTNSQNEKKQQAKKIGSSLFVGCMFLGMAAGWYFGNFSVGMFGGMGMGFILMAVAVTSLNNRNK